MSTFAYESLDTTGRRTKGKLDAENREAAIETLRGQGQLIVQLSETKEGIWTRDLQFGKKRVKSQEFVAFCRQFSALTGAGVTLVDALRVMQEQAESKVMASALSEISASVVRGNPLSSSMAEHDVFPPMFISMVRAGEASGSVEEVLDNLAVYTERQHDTTEKVKSALTYPIAVAVFAVFVVIFLLVKVIPTFVGIFTQEHLTLPLPTRIVLGVSHALIHQWYLFVIVGAAIVGGVFYLTQTAVGRRRWDEWQLHIPLFGILLRKSAVAKLCRVLSMLFTSAVPTLQAFSIAADVVGNLYFKDVLLSARDSLTAGRSISDPLRKSGAFPALVIQMIYVGEQTGRLDSMLLKVADFYEKDVDTMVTRLRSLIEPIMIVVLGAVVGTVVLAALLPMFSLYQNINQLQ